MTDKDTRARNDVFHVRPSFRGVMVYLINNATIATATATDISWEAAHYDTLGAWNVTNPTKLVVPANTRYVRVSGGAHSDNTAAADPLIEILKNGSSTYAGVSRWYTASLVDVGAAVASPILMVVPGDYFTLNITQSSGANGILLAAYTWFAMEAVG